MRPSGAAKPRRLKLAPVKGFRKIAVKRLAKRAISPGGAVVSDGLACFAALAEIDCMHHTIKTGSGANAAKHPAFKWANTSLGHVKNAIRGACHAVRSKHAPRYLARFQYRFNRRRSLDEMIPRFTWAGLPAPPMPYNLPETR